MTRRQRVEDVINQARRDYDANPTPQTMLMLVGLMLQAIARLKTARVRITDEETLYALRPWDKDMAHLMQRIEDYQVTLWALTGHYGISDAAKYHQVETDRIVGPRSIYTEHVMTPILYGNSSSTIAPDTHEWSRVQFPDIAMPVMLAHQLEDADQSLAARIERTVVDWFQNALNIALQAAEEVVDPFVQRKAQEAEAAAKNWASENMGNLIDVAQKEIEARAVKGAKKGVGPMLILAIGIGAVVLMQKR